MPILLALFLATPDSITDIERAQQLYEKARYDEALHVLGESCDQMSEIIKCERIRAFLEIAMGNEVQAVAAFQRMLLRDSQVDLGSNVSPKLRNLFKNARENIETISRLDMELDSQSSDSKETIFTVQTETDLPISKLTALIAYPEQPSDFKEIHFSLQDRSWEGKISQVKKASYLKYYLVVVLQSGVTVQSGSETELKKLSLSSLTSLKKPPDAAWDDPFVSPADFSSDDGDDKEAKSGPLGLRPWLFWTLVGGAIVIAGGVTAAILLSRDPKPGDIQVQIEGIN